MCVPKLSKHSTICLAIAAVRILYLLRDLKCTIFMAVVYSFILSEYLVNITLNLSFEL
jgi:hypothetical protein